MEHGRLVGRAARVAAIILAAIAIARPAAAEVTTIHPSGFIVRHEAVVEAHPKQVWLALISPDKWWRSEHTWTGDSANLLLTPKAGECFCERIPEIDEPDRFTLEGSVEHMRVIHAHPEQALRMRGGLGPLQSEPVNGVLTITITTEEAGTRIVWEYNVAGFMRYEIPVISSAVDGVIGGQLAALADGLGPVRKPAGQRGEVSDNVTDDASALGPENLPDEDANPAAPRVEDAFGDLIGE